MVNNPYKVLAIKLDQLPNGFPPTDDGIELKLLAKLFSPDEAELVSQLHLTLELPRQIAERIGENPHELRSTLKDLTKKGLIRAEPVDGGIGFGLLPFVVGIYEMQGETIDVELAELFETYYKQAFGFSLSQEPKVHRIIPINESIKTNLEVRPYESVVAIIAACKAWGVVDCICRKQKLLIGQPCIHPIDNCMVLSTFPGAFNNSKSVHVLTQQEAIDKLREASEAGLVHSVSNNQRDLWYICNCCKCSCGILRGMADLGLANVVAKSSFLNQVDEDLCILCGICVDRCPFDAIKLESKLSIDSIRCTGCGSCVITCTEGALSLALRPNKDQPVIPETTSIWMQERALSRGMNLLE
jgi:electron transport complex protein RnfB